MNYDYIAMLFSSDWFFDYWHLFGVNLPETKKIIVRDKLRAIVETFVQIELRSEPKAYFLSNFDDARLLATERVFTTNIAPNSQILNFVLQQKKESDQILWLMRMGTVNLVSNGSDDEVDNLADEIVSIISESWTRIDDECDFHAASKHSNSDWDQFLKRFCGEYTLPDLLHLYLGDAQFGVFWNEMVTMLTATQLNRLIDWYSEAIFALSGEKVAASEIRSATEAPE